MTITVFFYNNTTGDVWTWTCCIWMRMSLRVAFNSSLWYPWSSVETLPPPSSQQHDIPGLQQNNLSASFTTRLLWCAGHAFALDLKWFVALSELLHVCDGTQELLLCTTCSLCRGQLCTNTRLRVAVELWKCQPLPLTNSTISAVLGALRSCAS